MAENEPEPGHWSAPIKWLTKAEVKEKFGVDLDEMSNRSRIEQLKGDAMKLSWTGWSDAKFFSRGYYAGHIRPNRDGKWAMHVFRGCMSVTPYGGIRTFDSRDAAEQHAAKTVEADMIARGELQPKEAAVERRPNTELQWQQIGAIHVAVATRSPDEKPVTFLISSQFCDPRNSEHTVAIYSEVDDPQDRPRVDRGCDEGMDVNELKTFCQQAWDRHCEKEKPKPVSPLEDHPWIKVGPKIYEMRRSGRSAVIWMDGVTNTWVCVTTLLDGVTKDNVTGAEPAEYAQKFVEKLIENDMIRVAPPA